MAALQSTFRSLIPTSPCRHRLLKQRTQATMKVYQGCRTANTRPTLWRRTRSLRVRSCRGPAICWDIIRSVPSSTTCDDWVALSPCPWLLSKWSMSRWSTFLGDRTLLVSTFPIIDFPDSTDPPLQARDVIDCFLRPLSTTQSSYEVLSLSERCYISTKRSSSVVASPVKVFSPTPR